MSSDVRIEIDDHERAEELCRMFDRFRSESVVRAHREGSTLVLEPANPVLFDLLFAGIDLIRRPFRRSSREGAIARHA
ncbi:hypothetical protein [Arhodomonas sp. AD133]|uniref:hypothetical protein n=1 Tax=Arhodomonas sp. AD133 TaxID=3415009 RepID=UPI003EBDCA39